MASRSWFSIVKKKLLTRKKAPQGKKMMIIHNNTSITSHDEDNRISCVEVSNSNINSIEEVEKMADADVISDDMTTAPSVDDDDSAEEGRMIGAAVRIQSFFRGHLARRAFRALRSLVKLQAVVRGVCVRKQAWIALRCVHALVRLQDRLRSRHLLSHHPTMHIHSA